MVLRGEKRTQILRKKETTKTSTETALTIIAMKTKTGNLTRTGEIILIGKTTGPTTMTRTTLIDEKTIDKKLRLKERPPITSTNSMTTFRTGLQDLNRDQDLTGETTNDKATEGEEARTATVTTLLLAIQTKTPADKKEIGQSGRQEGPHCASQSRTRRRLERKNESFKAI